MSKNPITQTTYQAVLGRVIEDLRKSKTALKQNEIAQKIGITQSTWSRVTSGDTSITVELLDRIAKEFGVQGSEILKSTEKAIKQLESQGVLVSYKQEQLSSNTILLAGAALGALVVAALS